MKIFSIILIIVLILFVVSQIWAQRQVSGIETYPYRVVKTYDGFEVRTYEIDLDLHVLKVRTMG